jgi:hypothetical protein
LAAITPMSSIEYGNLKKEADDWYNNIAINDEGTSKALKLVKQYGELWYVKVALAALYPFAKRWFYFYANPELENSDDDDD